MTKKCDRWMHIWRYKQEGKSGFEYCIRCKRSRHFITWCEQEESDEGALETDYESVNTGTSAARPDLEHIKTLNEIIGQLKKLLAETIDKHNAAMKLLKELQIKYTELLAKYETIQHRPRMRPHEFGNSNVSRRIDV